MFFSLFFLLADCCHFGSILCHCCCKHRPCKTFFILLLVLVAKKQEEEESPPPFVVLEKKNSMVIPPITITCRRHTDCHCLCRPKKKITIPNVPHGFKRVLVPTPGARKCGAREYIIAHDLQQQPHHPVKKPLLWPKSSKLHPTLDAIPEVPVGYTRALVTVPGTKCGERDCIVVHEENGKLLLREDGDAVLATTIPDPRRKNRTSRRLSVREKILLPFELHDQIIKYAQDHMA
jgi:hypothetical protein